MRTVHPEINKVRRDIRNAFRKVDADVRPHVSCDGDDFGYILGRLEWRDGPTPDAVLPYVADVVETVVLQQNYQQGSDGWYRCAQFKVKKEEGA